MCFVEVIENTYAANLKCLVLSEKNMARLICDGQRLDTSSLFFYLCILKLPDKVKLKIAEIMYTACNYSLPNNIHKLFVLSDPIYMTQQNAYLNKSMQALI